MALLGLAPGTVFAGDYRVVEPLSAGGMGAVYVVEQASTGKRRALKLMHPQLVANPDLRRRFDQEARIGSKIESEHIVEVHAAGVDQASGTPWLVMELLRGEDLAAWVTARGPVPPSDAKMVLEQLCHGVAAAHDVGIVHRDLKPENVFIASSRHAGATMFVKVLDFGIAKLSAESGTRSTAAMGSPMWMAPEQTSRAAITPAADVWALGLIAHFMLTGTHFWRAASDGRPIGELLREIVIDPIPPASARAAEVGRAQHLPPGFDGWFARCVDREPTSRFRDAREAWTALVPLFPRTHDLAPPHPVAPPHAIVSPDAMALAVAPTSPYQVQQLGPQGSSGAPQLTTVGGGPSLGVIVGIAVCVPSLIVALSGAVGSAKNARPRVVTVDAETTVSKDAIDIYVKPRMEGDMCGEFVARAEGVTIRERYTGHLTIPASNLPMGPYVVTIQVDCMEGGRTHSGSTTVTVERMPDRR